MTNDQSKSQMNHGWLMLSGVLLLASLASLMYTIVAGHLTLFETTDTAWVLMAVSVVFLLGGIESRRRGAPSDD